MRVHLKAPGLTIVELLVVVVVIAILAAITVVTYNGIQEQAKISQQVATLSQVSKTLHLYEAKHGESAYQPGGAGIHACIYPKTNRYPGWSSIETTNLLTRMNDISTTEYTPTWLIALSSLGVKSIDAKVSTIEKERASLVPLPEYHHPSLDSRDILVVRWRQ